MADSFAKSAEAPMFQWLATEPLLEAFPVNYAQVVTRPYEPVVLRAKSFPTGKFRLTMLRNVVNIEESMGKPLREKYHTEKRLIITPVDYLEDGSGNSISDIADMKTYSSLSATIKLVSAPQKAFSGNFTESTKLKGSVAFMSLNAKVEATTGAEFLAIRAMDSGELIAFNIPGYPFLPGRAVAPGDQWEITGYTEQKTNYRYPEGVPPASLAAATLILYTYQYHGLTEYANRRCAYIEMFGETYEMRDFGGNSTLPALKAVAKTMSRSPIGEVRDYLSRRTYTSTSSIKGSFQASSKVTGYALVDLTTMQVLQAKIGKEGLTGGGSSIGIVQGTGKGIFREQWILENKAE